MLKRVAALLVTAVLLNGCVLPNFPLSGPIIPTQDQISKIQSIAIAAIEPPPLTTSSIALSPSMNLVEMFVALKPSEKAIPLHDALNRSDAWIPTVELARETTAQLRAGWGINVDLVDGYLALPGVEDRGRTFYMENWLSPLRGWYNDEQSSFDYGQLLNKKFDAVLVVGLLNYEMLQDKLIIQVMSKLVDPITNRVIGRSNNLVFANIPPIDVLIKNELKIYKEIFARATRDLIAGNLWGLGLLR